MVCYGNVCQVDDGPDHRGRNPDAGRSGPDDAHGVDQPMSHRAEDDKRTIWTILRDAGIVVIVIMGIALLAIAVAVGFMVGGRLV